MLDLFASDHDAKRLVFERELPYPPSVNSYWRFDRRSGRVYVSAEGRAYSEAICALLKDTHGLPLQGRLGIDIVMCAPDNRRRDVDNISKALLDALGRAGVYTDDSQIDDSRTRRGVVRPRDGAVLVRIYSLEPKLVFIPPKAKRTRGIKNDSLSEIRHQV